MSIQLNQRTTFGATKIFDGDGAVMATFSGDDNGQLAYKIFVNGLVQCGGFSLLNENTGKFLVGTVDQLDAA